MSNHYRRILNNKLRYKYVLKLLTDRFWKLILRLTELKKIESAHWHAPEITLSFSESLVNTLKKKGHAAHKDLNKCNLQIQSAIPSE